MKLWVQYAVFAAAMVISFLASMAPAHAGPEFNPDHVVGFEVLVLGACDGSFDCSAGHSFLRLVGTDGAAEDKVLTFSTNGPSPVGIVDNLKFTARAVVGLPLTQDLMNFSGVVRSYVFQEKRTILRIPLQLSSLVKSKILENIESIVLSQRERGLDPAGYSVLFNNCAGKIVQLLNQSGVPRELFGFAIPVNLPAHLHRTYVALYPPIEVDVREQSSVDALPASFYKYCDDATCATEVVRNFEKIWPGESIEFPSNEQLDPEFRKTLATRTVPNNWSGQKKFIDRHFELLKASTTQR